MQINIFKDEVSMLVAKTFGIITHFKLCKDNSNKYLKTYKSEDHYLLVKFDKNKRVKEEGSSIHISLLKSGDSYLHFCVKHETDLKHKNQRLTIYSTKIRGQF